MSDNRLYEKALKWEHMTTAASGISRSGQAKLHHISVNNPAGSTTATIYNNSVGTGEIVAVVDTSVFGTLSFEGIPLPSGLTVVTDGAADITVIYE